MVGVAARPALLPENLHPVWDQFAAGGAAEPMRATAAVVPVVGDREERGCHLSLTVFPRKGPAQIWEALTEPALVLGGNARGRNVRAAIPDEEEYTTAVVGLQH